MTNVNGTTGQIVTTTSSFLELQLFGAPQLRLNQQALHHTLTGKPLALLLYLAVTGHPHTRDVLATLLWSELSIQQARNNLRYVLPVLRRLIAPYLCVTTQTISFNRQAPYWQDVEVLRTTLQGNLAALSTAQLQATLALYQSEFLAGFRVRNAPAFVAWLMAQRQQLQTLMLQGLLHLAERQLAQREYSASQSTRQRLIALLPNAGIDITTGLTQAGLDLAHYQHLMPWLKASEGQLTIEQVLGSQSATVALEEPTAQIEATQPDELLTRLVNSLRAHNLPNQLTPFFGRQQEITDILSHLAKATYRLLTLTGEGGMGKTRLALAIAQSIINSEFPKTAANDTDMADSSAARCNLQFHDGIWFVPLAHVVATADLQNQVAAAIAKAIQLPLNDQDTPTTQIIHYFADKRGLLILDNFEHLSASIDFILQLLHETVALKLLITSRHRLNVQAEYPWRLTGLTVPGLTTSPLSATVIQQEYPGIALFVERARRAHPGFHLEAGNLTAVIQICHFVQGLPLGIELAAALTKEYTCSEVWAILRHNYNILVTTLPDLPLRHRNIKVVLDHSWRFLSMQEARVLAGCSVFCGQFEREAASAIADASPPIIAKLIDQSLLHWTAEAAGQRWLNLHELVRHYAAEQLAATPAQRQQVYARHAAYYLGQLQAAETALLQNSALFQQMHSSLANIQMAWLWSCKNQQWPLLTQGLWGLTRLYRLAGLYQDALQTLQVAIAAVRAVLPTGIAQEHACLLPRLLNSAAEFCRYLGRTEEGEELAQAALEWGHQFADLACQSRACYELARLAQRRGQHLQMRLLAEQASTLAQQVALPRLAAKSLIALGGAELLCGNLAQSNRHYDLALRYLTAAPDAELEVVVHVNLGAGHLSCHNYALAHQYLTQALTINQSISTPYKNGTIYVFLGMLYSALGAYEQARQTYLQAQAMFKAVYEPYWESWVRTALAHLQKQWGNVLDARFECEQVLALVKGKIPLLEHCILSYLGDIHYQQGDWTASEIFYRQALMVQHQAQLRLRLAEPTVQLAHLLLQRSEADTALALLEEPLATLTAHGLGALNEPFGAYWVGYQVLKANADPRAMPLLQEAYHRLRQQADQLADANLRHSFLDRVRFNRLLVDAAQTAGLTVSPALPALDPLRPLDSNPTLRTSHDESYS